jgi:uncharacterized protein (DUF1800 family)
MNGRRTGIRRLRKVVSTTAPLIASLLFCQPVFTLVSKASQAPAKKNSGMTDHQRVAHVLSRLTFGARPGDFEKVKAMGVDAFIAQQLDPDSLDNSDVIRRLRRLPTLAMATPVIIEQYTPPKPGASPSPSPTPDRSPASAPKLVAQDAPAAPNAATTAMSNEMQMEAKKDESERKPGAVAENTSSGQMPTLPAPKPSPPPKNPQMVVTELQRSKLLRAVYSERQLYEMMVDFWENHFNVFANKDADRYLLTSYDRETIRPFAMGRFRDLLGATAHSPAMLYYLDNWRSSVARPYPAKKDKPAGVDGGLNENYARELMELHTLGVDGGYTQKDVQEVARCFTGWTIQKPNEQGLFLYRPGYHDDGEKLVLGHRILAGGGIADGERVLDVLARHPATARFIATKLARRFISDDPPAQLVDRAAAVFLKTDGSITETLRAIVTSPEFFSANTYRAKMRSPFEYVAAAMRGLNADTDADRAVLDALNRMGQPLFGRVTPDGYGDRTSQWLSSGAMVARFNFASALANNRIKGTKIDFAKLLSGIDQANKDSVTTKLTGLMIFGDVSSGTRAALEKAKRVEVASNANAATETPSANVSVAYDPKTTPTPAEAPAPYVAELLTLLIGSPEFQQR